MTSYPIPADRELDVAVARALGWTEIDADRFGLIGKDQHFTYRDVPQFETDWSQLPVMLAWLRSRTRDDIQIECGIYGVSARVFGHHFSGHDDTLLLAVCRLVLAVAGREEKKP